MSTVKQEASALLFALQFIHSLILHIAQERRLGMLSAVSIDPAVESSLGTFKKVKAASTYPHTHPRLAAFPSQRRKLVEFRVTCGWASRDSPLCSPNLSSAFHNEVVSKYGIPLVSPFLLSHSKPLVFQLTPSWSEPSRSFCPQALEGFQ